MSKCEKVSQWFGLSYASFLVIPRVLMQDMPEEWQSKMVELLEQYDDAFDQSKVGIDGCRVQAALSGKLCKMPSEIKNYRRPCQSFLKKVRNDAQN